MSVDPEESEPLRYTGHLLRRAQQVHLAVWQREVSNEVTSVQFAALAVLDRVGGPLAVNLASAAMAVALLVVLAQLVARVEVLLERAERGA